MLAPMARPGAMGPLDPTAWAAGVKAEAMVLTIAPWARVEPVGREATGDRVPGAMVRPAVPAVMDTRIH